MKDKKGCIISHRSEFHSTWYLTQYLLCWQLCHLLILRYKLLKMLLTRLPATVVIILSCLIGMLVAQTFQYSRGWTNGRKRSSLKSPRDIDCQLQRLRAIIEGKNDQLYWPCGWQNYPETGQHAPPAVPPSIMVDNSEEN